MKNYLQRIVEEAKKIGLKSCEDDEIGIKDPGAKTVDSLIKKVIRKISVEKNINFSLLDINDSIRASIVIDNFTESTALLKSLKKELPNLLGYFSRYPNGYKGIHLNYNINGLLAEVQIQTPDQWIINKITSDIYEKWRDFNPNRDLIEIIDLERKNPNAAIQKRIALNKQVQMRESDFNLCKKYFSELWQNQDLQANELTISAILQSFGDSRSIKNIQSQFPKELVELLSQPIVSEENNKIVINRDLLRLQSETLNNYAKQVQPILISNINLTYKEHEQSKSENTLDNELTDKIKFIVNLYNAQNEKLTRALTETGIENPKDFISKHQDFIVTSQSKQIAPILENIGLEADFKNLDAEKELTKYMKELKEKDPEKHSKVSTSKLVDEILKEEQRQLQEKSTTII